MPGVLIVEAIAQTASVMVAYSDPEFTKGKLVFFTTIENARFRQPVRPGDVLELKIVKKGSKGPLWKFTGTANVEAKVVANCEFGAMIVDPDR